MPDFKAKNGNKNKFFDPEELARTRSERFGFVPDPEYPTYHFHPEAKLCITAKCTIKDGAIAETGYIPMVVNKEGVPMVVKKDEWGEIVFDYVKKITEKAGLNSKFSWDGDEVIIGS